MADEFHKSRAENNDDTVVYVPFSADGGSGTDETGRLDAFAAHQSGIAGYDERKLSRNPDYAHGRYGCMEEQGSRSRSSIPFIS